MKLSNETKVGILSALAILILILGFKFLKGEALFENKFNYYVEYKNINGLTTASQVVLNGLPIGRVKTLSLNSSRNNIIVAKLSINKDISIPINSEAKIVSADLLGTKQIAIIYSKSAEFNNNGDTLIGSIEQNLQQQVSETILPVQQKANQLLGSMDTMVQVIGLIFNESNRKHIDSSLYSFYNALETMSNTAEQIDTVVANEAKRLGHIFSNVESITNNLSENNEHIASLMKNLSHISDSLKKSEITKTINNAKHALNDFSSLVEKVNEGEGSMGMLINDKALYYNLQSSSSSLDSLLKDLKENPSRYLHFSVFGSGKKKKKKKANKNKWGY